MALSRSSQVCKLCEKEEIPGFSEEHQKLLSVRGQRSDIHAHYFCLLFSSGLSQKGEENEGLEGFLIADIQSELKRGARLKCYYCKKKGATVGCARQTCKKTYHLPCGMANNSLQQFYDQFKSFCSTHRPTQKVKRSASLMSGESIRPTDLCSICQDEVLLTPSPKSIWTPCCGAFYHPACIQKTALSAGSFHFRCPLCNDSRRFVGEMQEFGIYIPTRDATWEMDDDLESVQDKKAECMAHFCFCDKEASRKYDSPDSLWEILGCYACGVKGIHAKCGGLDEYIDPHWYCYDCRRAEDTKPPSSKTLDRQIIAVWGTASAKKAKMGPSPMSNEPPTVVTSVKENVIDSPEKLNEFRMKVPIQKKNDLMSITLEEIIVKGLDEKLRETNYKSKIFVQSPTSSSSSSSSPPQANALGPPAPPTSMTSSSSSDEDQRASTTTKGKSPTDSDYESAQEAVIPFPIRKNLVDTNKKIFDGPSPSTSIVIRKVVTTPPSTAGQSSTAPFASASAPCSELLHQSEMIGQRITNSITQLFREATP